MKNKTGLREALEVILDAVDYKEGNCLPTQMVGGVLPSQLIDNARKTLAEEKAELSLAELADKKGMFVDISREKTGWDIEIVDKRTGALFESITGKTYAECEEKAIKYLEGLNER